MDVRLPADWVDRVLAFWFEELTPPAWFKPDPALDVTIRSRFLTIHEAVAANPPDSATMDARTALAAIIALDQFPRNMFRGTPGAFGSDRQALSLAREGVDRGLDSGMSKDERAFFYLPFEHSENVADQERSVRLFEATGDAEYTKYAVAHKVIIDRFGRFPHRNAILGRTSTPEEVEFLKQPGSGF
jgi:uncharacterized protein (DUF924 family)